MFFSSGSKSLLLCLVAGALPANVLGIGSGSLYTYYDESFTAPGSSVVMKLGPGSWPDLLIEDNQCGGIGQSTGYGQSPIVVPGSAANICNTDLTGYDFVEGTCDFHHLTFHLETNGVSVSAEHGHGCSLGLMKIPGSSDYVKAKEIHIGLTSEHSIDGKYFPAEMRIVHEGADHEDAHVMFSMFIDESSSEHEVFEHYLQGWEAVHKQTELLCAAMPEGTGIFNVNRLFTSKQQFLKCPAVGSTVSADEVNMIDWVDDHAEHGHRRAAAQIPHVEKPAYPDGPIPNIYEDFVGDSGIFSYRGGLTTPPCTEMAHWNLVDTPIAISSDQLDRLQKLVLCYTERSTCRHATVASAFGTTNRPPQSLQGRTILHRCPDGPAPANGAMALEDPIPPKSKAYKGKYGVKPWKSVLFPWFVLTLGFITYYILSRWMHFLPYTAMMFIFGTFMGLGISMLENTDHLSVSTAMWSKINSELLFLTFLPGLIFRDAFCLNIHLLKDALFQCLIMAFPLVLAGTGLLGLVAYYILPYGWSFSLSMTFGAILSATDPVAVSALLNEVGAPPRLKMHISGESLLNDGSAMVFYTIFASIFLYEQGIPGFDDVDVAGGFKLFFKMSLGAVGIGLAFGMGLVRVLFMFNKRFNHEESVVQVTATITLAYLCYYVAEGVCHTSGVLAVVACGVITKAFGYNMINDQVMMEKFWVLVEHLLNTVLFALGGVVWGTVISNSSSFRSETFSGEDWGYLILVYIFMMIIRLFLFAAAYPIIGRIGLKSSWKEVVFMSFGGLRGAVGIALAIGLDNEVLKDTVPGDPAQDATSQLFGLVGGAALLTLIINGTLCGPFLRKLGLADSTHAREKIVESYRTHTKNHIMDKMLIKFSDDRFQKADFMIAQRHVPILRDITVDDLKIAVKRQKANTPVHEYKKPNLASFQPIVKDEVVMREINGLTRVSSAAKLKGLVMKSTLSTPSIEAMAKEEKEFEDEHQSGSEDNLIELRKIFIELLRYAYKQQVENGEVEVRLGLIVFALEQSVEYAEDAIAHGEPLCDWDMLIRHKSLMPKIIKRTKDTLDTDVVRRLDRMQSKKNATQSVKELYVEGEQLEETKVKVLATQRAIAFVQAHQEAERYFKEEFTANRFLSDAERQVLDESRGQVAKAEEFLQSLDQEEFESITSHLLCTILLNNTASFIGELVEQGLLKEKEGEGYLHELVEHDLAKVNNCVKEKKCKKLIEREIEKQFMEKEQDILAAEKKDIESGGATEQVASPFPNLSALVKAAKQTDSNNEGTDIVDNPSSTTEGTKKEEPVASAVPVTDILSSAKKKNDTSDGSDDGGITF